MLGFPAAKTGQRKHFSMDHLMLISVERVAARAIALRSIWATTADIVTGYRRTELELFADRASLRRRLAELVPLLGLEPPAAADVAAGDVAAAT